MEDVGKVDATALEGTLLGPAGQEAPLVVRARAVVVRDTESHKGALLFLTKLAELKAERVAHYKDPKQKAHAAWKAITAAETKDLSVIDFARQLVQPAVLTFERQEREREEAERAKAQAEEKARLDQLALEEAQQLAEQGYAEEAEAVLQEQVEAPPPEIVVPTQRAQVAGVSTSTTWKGQVVDAKLFLHWLADQHEDTIKAALGEEIASKEWLNLQARAMRRNLNIPGLVAREETGLRVGRSGR